MAQLPKAVQKLIEAFQQLPGIGPKSASRLTFYLWHVPEIQIQKFAEALIGLKKNTVVCSVCFNISEFDPCQICSDNKRQQEIICVVEEPIDVLAVENSAIFHGVYHVLGGAINPLNNIGPDEIKIYELVSRVKKNNIKEILIATNPSMEGEATAMYLKKEILKAQKVKITRLAHGLPIGADIEFSDSLTLSKAIEGRRDY